MRKLKGFIPTTFLIAMIAFGAVTTPAGIIIGDLTETETPKECKDPDTGIESIFEKVVSFAKTGIIIGDFAPCGIIIGDFKNGIIIGD